MSSQNCTVREDFSGWVIAALWEQVAICFVGAISNIIAICCLVNCQRTGKAVKTQLICIFSLMVGICVVTLPFVTYLYYSRFFCHEEEAPMTVQFFFSILNSMLLQGERMNFSAMAVFRLAAVCCPRLYKKMVTTKVVAALQVGIFLYVVPPWVVLGFLQKFEISHSSTSSVMRLEVKDKTSDMFKFVTALYGLNYCLPFVITFLAYTIMMVSIIRQNRLVKLRTKKQNTHSMDHVAVTIRIVILTNLLLDGPHIIVHLLQEVELASIITHMIFFLHIVLDPVFFVCLNQHYRETLWKAILKCLHPKCSSHWHSPSQSKEVDETSQEHKDLRATWHHVHALIFQKRNAVYVP